MNGAIPAASPTASAAANPCAPGAAGPGRVAARLTVAKWASAASLHPVPADLTPYEEDGADARRHGYGLDRNPYQWTADRGEELAGHVAKRLAWNRGWHFPSGAPSYASAPAPAVVVPDLPPHCGSWVIVRRDTGQGVLETFSRAVCERVNAASYEVLTAADYLGALNARIRAGQTPEWARA